MKNLKIKWLLLMSFMGMLLPLRAQRDSIQFSLLTCAPGSEIYSLFGHTALRYQNFSRGADVVFNYGMFSFNAPHFIYRFVKGETDYQLGVVPYSYFEAEYAMRGSSVYQQTLNLTYEEKQRLWKLLEENYRPENRVYRYNYFYDNCTTRARDQIEKCVEGKIVYPHEEGEEKSFRKIIHEFTAGSPWDELGIDFCLGAEADKTIGDREQMFAPFYLRKFAGGAYILGEDGNKRLLVTEENTVVRAQSEGEESAFPLSPMMCASLFLALNVWIAWWQWKRKRVFWGWDICLYALQGMAGCVIAFLFFFSLHPTVGSNWMLALFNPLPLLFLPSIVWCDWKRKKNGYHVVNLIYLTLFIVIIPFLPQEFNLTVLPLALGLLVNSASHILISNK